MPSSSWSSTGHRLVLLRHGATEWSDAGRHTGRTDLPLTGEGETAARVAGRVVAAAGLSDPLVITSPRRRARRTAELAGLTVSQVWDDLAEWDYGDYEGLTTAEIRQRVGHWTVWTHPCPNGESAESVQARADTVLAVAGSGLTERDVVLVGHGHFFRALISRWIELPVVEGRRFDMSAGAVTILGFEHETRSIHRHNMVAPW